MNAHACAHAADAPRAMTRCECMELSFEALAARMLTRGESVAQALDATGCGSLCTACVPDLRVFLTRVVREQAA